MLLGAWNFIRGFCTFLSSYSGPELTEWGKVRFSKVCILGGDKRNGGVAEVSSDKPYSDLDLIPE
jgi:hypothetical protein